MVGMCLLERWEVSFRKAQVNLAAEVNVYLF